MIMKNSIKHILTVALVTILGFSASAQTLNSLYFLDGNTQRHNLNPAFTCDKGWITTPLLVPSLSVNLNSNIGLEAIMRPSTINNDEMVTFLHPSITAEDAMSKFQDMNTLETDISLNILTIGFKGFGGTNTIALNVKSNTGLYIPKDIFRFLKEGQEEDGTTEYNIDNFGVRTQNYAEIALGHARDINSKLSVGAKVKFLLGAGYANADIEHMRIYMSGNEWTIEQQSSLVASKGMSLITKDNGKIDDFEYEFKMGGFGLGFDLGAIYRLQDNLNLSFAITDLGFINWSDATKHTNVRESYTYDGFDNFAAEESKDFEDAAEDVGDALEEFIRFKEDTESTSQTSSLYTTFRAGAEYGLVKDKITLGFLGTMRVGTPKTYTEGMLTLNLKPSSHFNMAINGSLSSTHGSMGATLNFNPSFMNFFIGADYLLAKYSKQVIPVDAAKFNFAMGMSFRL